VLATKGQKIDLVVGFEVDQKVLEERICGRRVHKNSGRSYHLTLNPPKVDGKDDITGEPLFHRADDTAEALGERLNGFNEMTKPIFPYYEKQGKLKQINATAPIKDVAK